MLRPLAMFPKPWTAGKAPKGRDDFLGSVGPSLRALLDAKPVDPPRTRSESSLSYPIAPSMDLAMFNQIAQITDSLYLSSAAAVRADRVKALGITHIINCTLEIPNLHLPNVKCIQIHVDDMPNARLSVYFDRCADEINHVERSGGRTLVHCVAGVSRSATLCIAYLMKHHRMNLLQAHRHVKRCRTVVRPNLGFWKQLMEYERKLFGRNTVKMVQTSLGWIPDIYTEETKNMVWVPGGRHGTYGY